MGIEQVGLRERDQSLEEKFCQKFTLRTKHAKENTIIERAAYKNHKRHLVAHSLEGADEQEWARGGEWDRVFFVFPEIFHSFFFIFSFFIWSGILVSRGSCGYAVFWKIKKKENVGRSHKCVVKSAITNFFPNCVEIFFYYAEVWKSDQIPLVGDINVYVTIQMADNN